MEPEVIVIGHKNPDLDSVASAVAFAKFKEMVGEKGWVAMRAGDLDSETGYVLGKFNIPIPERLENVNGKKIALVDHCDYCQMLDDMSGAEIVQVVDHHNIGDLKTDKPIHFHSEPVGSTCTIITSFFVNYGIKIPKNIAGLLLSGIISDTDLFKSPTTTPLDLRMKEELEKITGIKSEELGVELFKIKSDLASKKTIHIITEDLKEYEIMGKKVAVSQVKLMDLDGFLDERRSQVLDNMNDIIEDEKYDLFVVIITDLVKEGSEVFALGETSMFEKAMNKTLKNNSVYIPGLLSRKKQVMPQLMGLEE